jgi:hypothetical protein
MPQSCGVDQPGVCTFTFSGEAKWTGSFVGTSEYHAYIRFNPRTQTLESTDIWEHFVAVDVPGCGRGSMMWHGSGGATAAEQDPSTGKVSGHGTYTHVHGTGTGDLATVDRGSFETSGMRFQPPWMENHGDANGTIVCGAK